MTEATIGKLPLARPFLDGLAEGVLRYQRCTACSAAQTLARYACQRCGSEELDWLDAAGTGVVYATTIVTRAPSDAFRTLVPYTLALVDLDEGFRLLGHGAKDLSPGLAIGDRVAARVFEHAGRRLVSFTRVP